MLLGHILENRIINYCWDCEYRLEDRHEVAGWRYAMMYVCQRWFGYIKETKVFYYRLHSHSLVHCYDQSFDHSSLYSIRAERLEERYKPLRFHKRRSVLARPMVSGLVIDQYTERRNYFVLVIQSNNASNGGGRALVAEGGEYYEFDILAIVNEIAAIYRSQSIELFDIDYLKALHSRHPFREIRIDLVKNCRLEPDKSQIANHVSGLRRVVIHNDLISFTSKYNREEGAFKTLGFGYLTYSGAQLKELFQRAQSLKCLKLAIGLNILRIGLPTLKSLLEGCQRRVEHLSLILHYKDSEVLKYLLTENKHLTKLTIQLDYSYLNELFVFELPAASPIEHLHITTDPLSYNEMDDMSDYNSAVLQSFLGSKRLASLSIDYYQELHPFLRELVVQSKSLRNLYVRCNVAMMRSYYRSIYEAITLNVALKHLEITFDEYEGGVTISAHLKELVSVIDKHPYLETYLLQYQLKSNHSAYPERPVTLKHHHVLTQPLSSTHFNIFTKFYQFKYTFYCYYGFRNHQ